ncbi:hypothetical protein AD941_02400 [Gluconobacter albidus]|nr:hypothetical protein AD941_02400 [Gluconobacter albidus]
MKMRVFPLIVAWTFLAVPSAFGQSMPLWKSVTQTGSIRDLVLSAGNDNSVAAWLGKKADTQNGHLQNPVINQRAITSGPLQMSDIGSPLGVAALDAHSVVQSTGVANFDYSGINPASSTERLRVPVPSMMCPGTMGTTSPSAQCIAVQATTDSPAVVGQMIGVVNEDKSTDTQKYQVIQALGGLQDSPNSALWGQNIVLTQGPGTAGIAGMEIDMNRAATCDTAVDSWSDPKCPGNTGVWVTGLQLSNHVGSPAFVVAANPFATSPLFNVGYMVQGNSVRDTGFLDASSTSVASLRMYYGHTYGVDCSNAVFFNSCIAMLDSGTSEGGQQEIAWYNQKSTAAGTLTKSSRIYTASGLVHVDAMATGVVNVNDDTTTPLTELNLGSTKTAQSTSINLHSGGTTNHFDAQIRSDGGTSGADDGGTLQITASRIKLNGVTSIQELTKAQILGVANPIEGTILNDSDDHVPVVYENGHWYPMTLGPALQ